MTFQKVVKAEKHNNLTGVPVWRLTLACGCHEIAPAYRGSREVPAPSRMKCARHGGGG